MSTLEDEAVVEDEQFLEKIQQRTDQFNFFDQENSLLDGYLMHSNAQPRNGHTNKTLLSIEHKLDIVNHELDHIHSVTDETKKSSEKIIDTLKAVLEETDQRIAELRKEAYEFKRDIVVGAENFRTGKTMAEKVIRYMEEKLRHKDMYIEKMKLKNASIKGSMNKIEQQLKQKEEMGDVLHYIDFHQLQIENKQYIDKIEQRSAELLQLKMTTGKTVQALNAKKKELSELIAKTNSHKQEIKARKDQLQRIKEENQKVTDQTASRRKMIAKMKQQKEETADMPRVLDYVEQKRKMYELQVSLKNWERKVEIAAIAKQQTRVRPTS